ncbi:MAG: zinc-ribbon domain-containing protein, partial [Acetanaerobacterium sp.]
MKRCKQCNTPLRKGDLFCPRCGARGVRDSLKRRKTRAAEEVILVSAADVVVKEYAAAR